MENKSKFICKKPFIYIETHIDGDITICCPAYVNHYSIGNFFEAETFEEIWNGEKAQEFRTSVLDGSYKYCNVDLCFSDFNQKTQNTKFDKIINYYPIEIKFCHDRQCNARCTICRDEQIYTDKETEEKLDKLIDTFFLPMLKDAKLVWLNGAGEFFASKHMRKLAKAITTNYPNIKFGIHSNGLFFDKKNCDELGITDKIVLAEISIHAATKKTYNKIVRDGNFDKVIKNVHWLSNLKQKNQIKDVNLDFVITAINYKEMRSFQKLANKLNCKAVFTTYRPWDSELATRYNEMAIFEPTHPDYKKFRKHLNSKLFLSQNCKLQNSLLEIINEGKNYSSDIHQTFIKYLVNIYKMFTK